MWVQEEPQHSTNMWNSRPEGQGAGPLGGTSAVGDIKEFSVDNWRGAGGTPSTGVGTAEGLPSPTPLWAAILVSSDGEGGPESTGLGYKEPLCRSNGTPLSALTHSTPPRPC